MTRSVQFLCLLCDAEIKWDSCQSDPSFKESVLIVPYSSGLEYLGVQMNQVEPNI